MIWFLFSFIPYKKIKIIEKTWSFNYKMTHNKYHSTFLDDWCSRCTCIMHFRIPWQKLMRIILILQFAHINSESFKNKIFHCIKDNNTQKYNNIVMFLNIYSLLIQNLITETSDTKIHLCIFRTYDFDLCLNYFQLNP